jgi:hypothetical protein
LERTVATDMPTKKKVGVRRSPVVAKVIRPVATRLNRIEDLLLDFHLKRIAAIQKQVDVLIEQRRVRSPD